MTSLHCPLPQLNPYRAQQTSARSSADARQGSVSGHHLEEAANASEMSAVQHGHLHPQQLPLPGGARVKQSPLAEPCLQADHWRYEFGDKYLVSGC
ncbi:MAG: hypothetical protein FRX49_00844 [Trebouxia sp. A1-2]|nr:MAG: hypothetical protein FRX49_00844 [Trebouxia sp. A1-2]